MEVEALAEGIFQAFAPEAGGALALAACNCAACTKLGTSKVEVCEVGSGELAVLKAQKATDKCRPGVAAVSEGLYLSPEPEPKPVRRLSINLPATHPVRADNARIGTGIFPMALSPDGTLLVLPAKELPLDERKPIWVDRKGNEEVLAAPPRPYRHPRIAPDGERIAGTIGGPGDRDMDVWLCDLARGVLGRFTLNPGHDFFPCMDAGRTADRIRLRAGRCRG